MPLDSTAACAVEKLPRAHLVLAIAQAHRDGCGVEDVQARLWREDLEEVAVIFAAVEETSLSQTPETGIGLLSERIRQAVGQARKAAPEPHGGHGLTLEKVAERAEVSRETLAALMEHHGFLEMMPYGPGKNRRLATDTAIAKGLGHNVEPGRKRVGAVESHAKAAPFPVFYEDGLADVLWVLDLGGIRATAARRTNRAERLAWLLDRHGYLPGSELAKISGYSLRAVRTAQAARTALAGYKEDGDGKSGTKTAGLLHWVCAGMPVGVELHPPVIEEVELTEDTATLRCEG